MFEMSQQDKEEDCSAELALTYCGLAQDISKLDPQSQFQLLQHVEIFFDHEATYSDLGDFLNEFAKLLIFSSHSDLADGSIHQDMQNIIDDSDLDPDLLSQVCGTISSFYKLYAPLTLA